MRSIHRDAVSPRTTIKTPRRLRSQPLRASDLGLGLSKSIVPGECCVGLDLLKYSRGTGRHISRSLSPLAEGRTVLGRRAPLPIEAIGSASPKDLSGECPWNVAIKQTVAASDCQVGQWQVSPLLLLPRLELTLWLALCRSQSLFKEGPPIWPTSESASERGPIFLIMAHASFRPPIHCRNHSL